MYEPADCPGIGSPRSLRPWARGSCGAEAFLGTDFTKDIMLLSSVAERDTEAVNLERMLK